MGDKDLNIAYARKCLKHSLLKGESPIASHLLYPQVLNDDNVHERQLGIEAGLAWIFASSYSAFYTDLGWSKGMILALNRCIESKHDFILRGIFHQPVDPPSVPKASLRRFLIGSRI